MRRTHSLLRIPVFWLSLALSLWTAQPGIDSQARVSANVAASVGFDQGMYTYSYVVANQPGSLEDVSTIELDVTLSDAAMQLPATGLEPGAGMLTALSNAIGSLPEAVRIAPLVLSAPSGWVGTTTRRGHVLWGAVSTNEFIPPSSTRDGFVLTSTGLPAIRQVRLGGYLDVDRSGLAPPEDGGADLDRYKSELDALRATLSVVSFTVGPSAPPANSTARELLRDLIETKDQTLRLGWIRNRGLANSLQVKLNAAVASLERENEGTAANQLNAFVNEVTAQAGKGLSDEAAALLKFNALYLLTLIP